MAPVTTGPREPAKAAAAPRVMLLLSVGIGGGSLALFAYFLLVGAPVVMDITHSHAARLAWDSLLSFLFFFQHSGMIRRRARERIADMVPASYFPALYSISSGIVLLAVVLLWQPTNEFVFRPGRPAYWLSACLVLLAVAGTLWGVRSLRGFDPFGTSTLRSVVRGIPPASASFVACGAYRWVRHPLYLAMLVLIWSNPRLSTDRLLFNVLWTAWIVIGTRLEERDLVADFGQAYREYQRRVPMLIPSWRAGA